MTAFNDWGDPDPDHQPQSLLADPEIAHGDQRHPSTCDCDACELHRPCEYCGAEANERCNFACLGRVV